MTGFVLYLVGINLAVINDFNVDSIVEKLAFLLVQCCIWCFQPETVDNLIPQWNLSVNKVM